MANHFGDRLYKAVKSKKTPLIVGLDPVYSRLPAAITSHRDMNDEFDSAAAVDAIFDFCTQVMRIIAPMVPAVKMNIAFFENTQDFSTVGLIRLIAAGAQRRRR